MITVLGIPNSSIKPSVVTGNITLHLQLPNVWNSFETQSCRKIMIRLLLACDPGELYWKSPLHSSICMIHHITKHMDASQQDNTKLQTWKLASPLYLGVKILMKIKYLYRSYVKNFTYLHIEIFASNMFRIRFLFAEDWSFITRHSGNSMLHNPAHRSRKTGQE